MSLSDRLFGGIALPTMVMFVATVGAGGLDYVYQIFAGRYLGVQAYSELTALLSILMMVSVPALTVQSVLTRYISKFKANGEDGHVSWLIRRTTVLTLVMSLFAVIVVVALTPQIMKELELSSWILVALLALAVGLKVMLPVGMGILQGVQDFLNLGSQQLAGAIVKLGAAMAFMVLGYSVGGAFAGAIAGIVAAIVICFVPARHEWQHEPVPVPGYRAIWVYAIPSTVSAISIAILTNVDVVAARAFLDLHDAGLFSAASMLGKAILFLPAAVTAVMFPKMSQAHTLKRGTSDIALRSFGLATVLCGAAALVFFLIPDDIIGLLYGVEYIDAASTLQIMGFAMMLYSLANLFTTYGLATDNYGLIWILAGGTIVQVWLLFAYSSSPEAIAMVLLVSGLAICVASLLYVIVYERYVKG